MVDRSAPAPTLLVWIGAERHTLNPADGAVVLGRDRRADIQIRDDRISRAHLRFEPRPPGWEIIDTSTNGMFVDGVRQRSLFLTEPLTVQLGHVRGIPVRFIPGEPMESTQVAPSEEEVRAAVERLRAGMGAETGAKRGHPVPGESGGNRLGSGPADPSLRQATAAKLEDALQWAPGSIGGSPGRTRDHEATEFMTSAGRASLMAEAVEHALRTIDGGIARLPDRADPRFIGVATAILADLRKLETVAADTARHATDSPSIVLTLGAVRRRYTDLMLRAAESPSATLGQRLYRVRHRAELEVDEAAGAAGVPPEAVVAVEAEQPVPPETVAAIKTLIAELSG